jgi:hypothetical protein
LPAVNRLDRDRSGKSGRKAHGVAVVYMNLGGRIRIRRARHRGAHYWIDMLSRSGAFLDAHLGAR